MNLNFWLMGFMNNKQISEYKAIIWPKSMNFQFVQFCKNVICWVLLSFSTVIKYALGRVWLRIILIYENLNENVCKCWHIWQIKTPFLRPFFDALDALDGVAKMRLNIFQGLCAMLIRVIQNLSDQNSHTMPSPLVYI